MLARALAHAGHAVRGTTRDPARTGAITAAGAEPYVGDPDRIATLMEALVGTTIVVWLMGSAEGQNVRDLHGGRLRMLCEKLVDTPVRGLIYEAAGSVAFEWRQEGEMIARAARATWNIPLEVVDSDPSECEEWTAAMAGAVERLLAG